MGVLDEAVLHTLDYGGEEGRVTAEPDDHNREAGPTEVKQLARILLALGEEKLTDIGLELEVVLATHFAYVAV